MNNIEYKLMSTVITHNFLYFIYLLRNALTI